MHSVVRFATVALAIAAGLQLAHASGPIAVYALVDSVTFEPNGEHPERVRVNGIFITAEPRSDVYSTPQRGYVYFALPPQNQELAGLQRLLSPMAARLTVQGSRK